ncbi:hypothetical protein GLYMA_08G086950v4 [Glycine max]|nr:hypothetical protein GLYMA_08G086950v4 [Glycine max]KAH1050290.1 hypothetical protein GYH30_020660 [Glycine max]
MLAIRLLLWFFLFITQQTVLKPLVWREARMIGSSQQHASVYQAVLTHRMQPKNPIIY